jgi:tripartite ATP-independent transporter DctP family solute receptor
MKTSKIFIQMLVATVATLHTWAFSQTVIKLAHYGPTTDPVHVGALKFKEVLEKESAGVFKVEIFPQEQLGKGADMIIGTQVGSIDVSVTGNPFYGGVSPEQSALDIPFLFKSVDHAYRVIDGPLGRELMDKFDAKGLKGLAYWEIGFRNITNSVRPVRTPADLKGMKLRTTPNPMHIEAFKIWGANPAPMAISEVYLALNTRTVDGQENPTVHIAKLKFQEVQKYMSVTRHAFTAAPMVMNLAKFKALTPQQQAMFMKAAKEGALAERQNNASLETESLAAIRKAGVEVIENINTEPFRAAAYEPVRKMYIDKFGADILNKIDALK